MLFSDKLLFLHVPKTGGTSVTSYLIRHLPGPLTLTEPVRLDRPADGLQPGVRARLRLKEWRRQIGYLRRPKLRHLDGVRHETLAEARDRLAALGRQIEDFAVIFAAIRNPYDLEVSRFHFFRRGHHGIAGLVREPAEAIAATGDFASFARTAAFHGRLPGRIEDWFEIDGQVPPNFRLLRFEKLEADLRQILEGFCSGAPSLPRLNTSEHRPYRQYLTKEIEEAIYRKYRWLFDRGFYPRERF